MSAEEQLIKKFSKISIKAGIQRGQVCNLKVPRTKIKQPIERANAEMSKTYTVEECGDMSIMRNICTANTVRQSKKGMKDAIRGLLLLQMHDNNCFSLTEFQDFIRNHFPIWVISFNDENALKEYILSIHCEVSNTYEARKKNYVSAHLFLDSTESNNRIQVKIPREFVPIHIWQIAEKFAYGYNSILAQNPQGRTIKLAHNKKFIVPDTITKIAIILSRE